MEKIIAVKLRVIVTGEPTAERVTFALDCELSFYSGRTVGSGGTGEAAVKNPIIPRPPEYAYIAAARVDQYQPASAAGIALRFTCHCAVSSHCAGLQEVIPDAVDLPPAGCHSTIIVKVVPNSILLEPTCMHASVGV